MNASILIADGVRDERRSISRREFIASLAALSAMPAGLIAFASLAAGNPFEAWVRHLERHAAPASDAALSVAPPWQAVLGS